MNFKIYDEETAEDVIKTLDEHKVTYKIKKKKNKKPKEIKSKVESDKKVIDEKPIDKKPIAIDKKVEPVVKPKRGRKKLSKEEKQARKAKRTPEEQKKINERMAKMRAARIAKKANKK